MTPASIPPVLPPHAGQTRYNSHAGLDDTARRRRPYAQGWGTGLVTTSTITPTMEIATATVERPDKRDPRVQQLLERGQQQKYLSQADILRVFPDAGTNVDLFDHLYALFQEEHVDVIP